jgi:hypothetical protein
VVSLEGNSWWYLTILVHLKSVLIRDVAFDRKGLIIGGLLYFTICGKIMWRGPTGNYTKKAINGE